SNASTIILFVVSASFPFPTVIFSTFPTVDGCNATLNSRLAASRSLAYEQIFSDCYHFQHSKVIKRSTSPSEHHDTNLIAESQIFRDNPIMLVMHIVNYNYNKHRKSFMLIAYKKYIYFRFKCFYKIKYIRLIYKF
ncbi:hypothetical protein L9F63_005703, partial [Diploptera punctata]